MRLPGLFHAEHVEVVHHTAVGAQLRRMLAQGVAAGKAGSAAYRPGVAPGRLSSGTVPPPSMVAGSLPSQRRVVS